MLLAILITCVRTRCGNDAYDNFVAMTSSDSYVGIVKVLKYVAASCKQFFSQDGFTFTIMQSKTKYSKSVMNLFSLYRANGVMFFTTLVKRLLSSKVNPDKLHEVKKSSGSTHDFVPNTCDIASGVMPAKVC